MLTIRREQRAELREAVLRNFHLEMEKHLAEFAPERIKVAGPEGTSAFVSNGIKTSRGRGLHQRGAIRFWLETMVVLGHDFDTDPQYRGLWPDLDPEEFPMPFAQRFHKNVGDYLLACFGPEREILDRAIGRAFRNPVAPGSNTAGFMIALLRDAWPEKLEATGEKALQELAGLTDEEAAQAGLHGADGRYLVATLSLCFGSGVLHDPLYPWLHKRLFADVPESERVEKTRRALEVYALQAAPGARGDTYGS